MTGGKRYHFRIYYLVKDTEAIRKIKDKFRTTVNVNGESFIETTEEGAALILELENRRFIKIRNQEKI